jgi:hypothetical protein
VSETMTRMNEEQSTRRSSTSGFRRLPRPIAADSILPRLDRQLHIRCARQKSWSRNWTTTCWVLICDSTPSVVSQFRYSDLCRWCHIPSLPKTRVRSFGLGYFGERTGYTLPQNTDTTDKSSMSEIAAQPVALNPMPTHNLEWVQFRNREFCRAHQY